MTWLPFSIYDFFGYVASGLVVVAAADYAFSGSWVLDAELGVVFGIFWLVVAYILGHTVAHISSFALENLVARRLLQSPEKSLFADPPRTSDEDLDERTVREHLSDIGDHIFASYYKPLPSEIQTRVLEISKKRSDISIPGRGLFIHCHSVVLRDEVARSRLERFLTLYGFSRNISMALLISSALLLLGIVFDTSQPYTWVWLLFSLVISVVMFFRYLKFYRHYTLQVFSQYPEVD